MADTQIDIEITASDKTANAAFQKLDTGIKQVTTSTQNLAKTTGGFNMVGMNFNRIVQDSPYFLSSFNMGIMSIGNNIGPLAESFAQARKNGESFMSVVKSSIGGFGGYMLALNVAVAAITAFALANRGAKEEVDELSKSMKSMIDLTDPTKGLKFAADKATLEASIKIIDEEIKRTEKLNSIRQAKTGQGSDVDLLAASFDLSSQLTKEEQAKLDINKKELETFKAMKLELESRIKVAERLKELGFQQKQDAEKTAKATKDTKLKIVQETETIFDYKDALDQQKKYYELVTFEDENYFQWKTQQIIELGKIMAVQTNAQGEQLLAIQKSINAQIEELNEKHFKKLKESATFAGVKIGATLEPVKPVGEKPSPFVGNDILEMQKRQYEELNILAIESSQTLKSAFIEVWQSIFGEANNLLTQFLQNVASGIADLAAQKLASSIFSGLLGLFSGGATTAATAGAGFLGGPLAPIFSTKSQGLLQSEVLNNYKETITNYKETNNNNYREIVNNNYMPKATDRNTKRETKIINFQLGNKTLASAVVEGNNIATRLRYA